MKISISGSWIFVQTQNKLLEPRPVFLVVITVQNPTNRAIPQQNPSLLCALEDVLSGSDPFLCLLEDLKV